MVTDVAFRTEICLLVVGVLGTISSNLGLFLIPEPFYALFWLKRTVGDHCPMQHLAALLNCMFWVVYGLPFVKSDTIVTINNAVGCFIAMVYLILFAIYSKSWENRQKVIALLILEIIVVAITVAVVLSIVHDIKLRCQIFGTIAAVCQFGTYVAPFTTLKLVITTRDLKHMNWVHRGVSLINCSFWLPYVLVLSDIYLSVSCLSAMALGVVELLVFSYSDEHNRVYQNEERQMELP